MKRLIPITLVASLMIGCAEEEPAPVLAQPAPICGQVPQTVAQAGDTVVRLSTFRCQEITLWDGINDSTWLDGIHVEVRPLRVEDYESQLRSILRQAPSDNGPDLVSAKSGLAWFDPFVGENLLRSIEAIQIDVSHMAGQQGAMASDGLIYAVPTATQVQAMIYNKALLNELGETTAPGTLADLYSLFNKAQSQGYQAFSLDGRDGWYLNQVASEVLFAGLLSDDFKAGLVDGSQCFTDTKFVEALEEFNRLETFAQGPLGTDYGKMRTDVVLGDSLAMFDGAWTLRVWDRNVSGGLRDVNPDFEPVIAAYPGTNNQVMAHPDGGYALAANSANVAAATRVLNFATTEQFAQMFLAYTLEIPAYAKPYALPDGISSIASNLAIAVQNSSMVEPFLAYQLNARQPTYGALIASALQDMLTGKSAHQAARDIQSGLNSWNYVGAQNCSL